MQGQDADGSDTCAQVCRCSPCHDLIQRGQAQTKQALLCVFVRTFTSPIPTSQYHHTGGEDVNEFGEDTDI